MLPAVGDRGPVDRRVWQCDVAARQFEYRENCVVWLTYSERRERMDSDGTVHLDIFIQFGDWDDSRDRRSGGLNMSYDDVDLARLGDIVIAIQQHVAL